MKTASGLILITCIIGNTVYAQWTNIKDFPTNVQDGAFAIEHEGKLITGGGVINKEVYAYDPSTNDYTLLDTLPTPGDHLAWCYAFSIGTDFFITGGAYASASDLSNECWAYSSVTSLWSRKADFPGGPRDGGFAFVINGKAYVGCGFDGTNTRSDVFEYDPVADKWNSMAPFPDGGRIFPSFFVIGDRGYVGLGSPGGSVEATSFYAFDPKTNSWIPKAGFIGQKRQANYSFSYNNKGYVGGGMKGYAVNYEDVWSYDATTDTWLKMNDMELPGSNHSWGVACVVSDKVYVGLGVNVMTFAYNKEIYSYTLSDPTGIIKHNGEENVTIYPNPVSGQFNIRYNETTLSNIRVLTLSGQELPVTVNYQNNEITVTMRNPGYKGLACVTYESNGHTQARKILMLE